MRWSRLTGNVVCAVVLVLVAVGCAAGDELDATQAATPTEAAAPSDAIVVHGVTYEFDNGCSLPGGSEEVAYNLTVRDGDVYADLDVTTQDVSTPDQTTVEVVELVFRRTPDAPDQRAADVSDLTVSNGRLTGSAELTSDDGSSVAMSIALPLPTNACD